MSGWGRGGTCPVSWLSLWAKAAGEGVHAVVASSSSSSDGGELMVNTEHLWTDVGEGLIAPSIIDPAADGKGLINTLRSKARLDAAPRHLI